MQVEIKNYRGVSEAHLSMTPIALVAGTNGAGKSSIAQAISAALTKNPAPVDGIAKNAARQLMRDGANRGSCTVGDESGSVTANWPGASVSESGSVPFASEIACGLISLADMRPKDAAALLIQAVDALPTLDQMRAAMPDLDDQMLANIWSAIEADGWDSAHKRAQERGAKLKGAWEHLAGEKYGSQKAEGWAPAGTPDAGAVELESEIAAVRQALEEAIASKAASAAEVQALQARADAREAAGAELKKLEAEVCRGNAHAEKLKAELEALPKPETVETLAECPHCKGHLVVVSSTLVKAPTIGISAEENEQRQDAILAKQAEISRTRAALLELSGKVGAAQQEIEFAEQAKITLASMATTGTSEEQIASLRDDLEQLENDLSSVKRREQAAKLHADVVINQTVIDELSPSGLRQRVLAEKMGAFNATLARMSKVAAWPAVAIDEDLNITLGGRPYILLSESEKFRARTVLQVALADVDGSEAVIVDAADILDRAGRNGLFKLLKSSGMRALVCMTMNAPEEVPDISKAAIGQSYWLANNVLAPLSEEIKK